jgi:cytoskeletal protein RodZ
MRSVGETLKSERLGRGLSLEEVAKVTRIKKEFLVLIEANRFDQFSSLVTAKGFIKNYAEYLGFPSADVLAIFRRDNLPSQKKNPGFSLFHQTGRLNLNWNPKFTLILIIVTLIIGILGYLFSQYFRLRQSPGLVIITPKDKQQVFEDKITVSGRSDKDALVKINDNLVILTSKGEFSYELVLFPGENKIVVEAVSKFGQKSLEQRTVFRLDKSE